MPRPLTQCPLSQERAWDFGQGLGHYNSHGHLWYSCTDSDLSRVIVRLKSAYPRSQMYFRLWYAPPRWVIVRLKRTQNVSISKPSRLASRFESNPEPIGFQYGPDEIDTKPFVSAAPNYVENGFPRENIILETCYVRCCCIFISRTFVLRTEYSGFSRRKY